MNNMKISSQAEISKVHNSHPVKKTYTGDAVEKTGNFSDILESNMAAGKVKFSQHAVKRMTSRNINITDRQMEDINMAITKASDKGIKDSLVILEDTALIVSIRNRTIITAMEKGKLKDNIVTNIDGAIIV